MSSSKKAALLKNRATEPPQPKGAKTIVAATTATEQAGRKYLTTTVSLPVNYKQYLEDLGAELEQTGMVAGGARSVAARAAINLLSERLKGIKKEARVGLILELSKLQKLE